jgi:hypothetical protein
MQKGPEDIMESVGMGLCMKIVVPDGLIRVFDRILCLGVCFQGATFLVGRG